MTRLPFALVLAAGLLFTSAELLTAADDEKKKDDKPARKEPPAKAPDWSGYATAVEITGTVVAADDKGVTVQLTKLVPNVQSGSRSRRGGTPKVEATDYEFAYADGGMARWKKLPPKVGTDGKKVPYSPEETEKLRKPLGATGYAADRTDVQPGQLVEVVLVRPKSVPAAKATTDDLVIKYAIILGESPVPPKATKKEK